MRPSADRTRARRRWTGVAALGVLAAALGLGGVSSPVEAQAEGDPAAAFGGFNLVGRANGLQVSYNVENVFPLPPPLLQISVPEALASSQSGPTSTALGSAAFPGNVVGNLPAIVEQASPGNGQFIPPYPLASRADYPAGPTENEQDIGTASASVAAGEAGAQAITTMAASSVPGLLDFGSITTSATTGFEDGQVVARSRAEFGDITLLFGLITLHGVVTDIVATSNGETADATGTTTIGSVSILGLPATIGPDGLVVGEFTPPADPGPTAPLVENLGALGDLVPGLQDALAPVNDLLTQVLGASGTVNDLLAASGITITVLDPIVEVNGAEASITANGIIVNLNYEGSGDNPLAQLLALIPADQLPGEGLPGVPLNTSPQALVGLLKETHVTGLALAYGTASVVASPAFSFTQPPVARPATPTPSGGSSGSPGSPGTPARPATPGFSTPTPTLPASATPTSPIGDTGGGFAGAGIGVLAAFAILLTTPLWGIGSTKLADNVLAAASSACPDGLDQPSKPGGI